MAGQKSKAGSSNRKLLTFAGGAAALVAVVVLGVVLAVSGGGGDGTGTAATTSKEETAPREQVKEEAKEKPEPKRLSASALVAAADESCLRARTSYETVKAEFGGSKEVEEIPNVPFAKKLVGISSQQVKDLEKLVPPASKEDEFGEYLSSRRDVAGWDRDALDAARAGNAAAYQGAYAKRTETEPLRERLADEIGFEVCSQPKA